MSPVNFGFERIWKEDVVTEFEVLFRYLPVETEEHSESLRIAGTLAEIRTSHEANRSQKRYRLASLLGSLSLEFNENTWQLKVTVHL
jgi:hypothetical protein